MTSKARREARKVKAAGRKALRQQRHGVQAVEKTSRSFWGKIADGAKTVAIFFGRTGIKVARAQLKQRTGITVRTSKELKTITEKAKSER